LAQDPFAVVDERLKFTSPWLLVAGPAAVMPRSPIRQYCSPTMMIAERRPNYPRQRRK